jgi:hypothetical protein
MDLGLFFVILFLGVAVFVSIQLIAIAFLIKYNNELQADLEKNTPPF